MADRNYEHPRHGELYTPITEDVVSLLWRMKHELGSWREVCVAAWVNMRVLRKVYRQEHKVVSMYLMDKLITSTRVGSLADFPWYTPEQLVKMGVWKDVQYVEGDERLRISREPRDS